jgi:hypothetical protein
MLWLIGKYKLSYIMIDKMKHSFVHCERVSFKSSRSSFESIQSLLGEVKNDKFYITSRFLKELELV